MINKFFLPALSMLILPFQACAVQTPIKVITGKGIYQPAEAGQVQMKGFLGNRIDISREARLKKYVSEEKLLSGFRQRSTAGPWFGEFVGKWLDASILAIKNKPNDAELAAKIKHIAQSLMAYQTEDGYLGTYVEQERWSKYDKTGPQGQWGGWDVWVHKYVLIGLLNYYKWSGDEKALQACQKIGDLLIKTFGDDKKDILEAGTHAGMAATSILEPMNYLYQITGQKKYLDFCEYIIRRADAGSGILSNIEKTHSMQSVGNKKAYEMLSNYVGLVHYWRSTGDKRALQAAVLAWESVKKENLYITGSPEAHEYFVEPNTLATDGYCVETCVQVTWIQLTKELLLTTGDSRYAAALHHHYYNHMLAAQHPDGVMWCYMTPMEWKKPWSDEVHCCSSNGPRAIAWIPTIAYVTGKKQIAVNFYETSVFKTKLNDANITLCQKTDYPWDGNIIIDVVCDKAVTFDLQLLVPEFVRSGKIEVADSNEKIPLQAGKYAIITRTWTGKTSIALKFEMPIVAHRRNERYALSRGPIVFALENIQNSALTHEQVVPDISTLEEVSQQTTERFNKANQTSLAAERHPIYIKGKSANSKLNAKNPKLTLVFRPYCEAGANGEVISVWLPKLPTPPWRKKQ